MRRGRSITSALAAVGILAGGDAAASTATTPGGSFVPGEVVVGISGGGERVVELEPGERLGPAIKRLAASPRIAYAHRNWRLRIAYEPLDRGSSDDLAGWRQEQWSFLGAPGGVRVLPAWRRLAAQTPPRPGGRRVTVAIVDTGVAFRDWDDFAQSPGFTDETRFHRGRDLVAGGPPLDRNGHGTHIAGTIAEPVTLSTPLPEGEQDYLTGIAHNATVMPVRVLNANGTGSVANVVKGIRWAANNGADVINVSLTAPPRVRSCADVRAICRAVQHATSEGALVVAAAGNTSGGGAPRVLFPAAAPGALAVGAATESGCLAEYSHHGARLDLIGPGGGRQHWTAFRDRCSGDRAGIKQVTFRCFARSGCAVDPTEFEIREVSGSSMAAAHASGVAALARAAGTPPRRLAERLRCSARPLGQPRAHGGGLLDAARTTMPRPPARCRR